MKLCALSRPRDRPGGSALPLARIYDVFPLPCAAWEGQLGVLVLLANPSASPERDTVIPPAARAQGPAVARSRVVPRRGQVGLCREYLATEACDPIVPTPLLQRVRSRATVPRLDHVLLR